MADGGPSADEGTGFTLLGESPVARIRIIFEGRNMTAVPGQSVAAVLLAAGIFRLRSASVSAAPCGAYCMMGVCFDCLLVVDGALTPQACMTLVRDGMRVETQDGSPDPTESADQSKAVTT